MASSDYDWRTTAAKRGWPYKEDAPFDTQWLKDRSETFQENGNGWWRFTSNIVYKEFRERYLSEKS